MKDILSFKNISNANFYEPNHTSVGDSILISSIERQELMYSVG